MNRRLIATVGFLVSLGVVGGLVAVVGLDRIETALATADLRLFALGSLLGVAQIGFWGLSLRSVLGALETEIGRKRGVLLYGTAMFSNNVTPFGQAGGEPIAAYAINRVTETKYESALAAIATLDTVNVVTSLCFILLGSVFTLDALRQNRRLATLGTVWIATTVVLLALVVIGWRYRTRLANLRVVRTVLHARPADDSSFVERLRRSLRDRLSEFGTSLRAISADRPALVRAHLFSGAGWLCNIVALWVVLWGLDGQVSVWLLAAIVPLSMVAGFVPLPGGLGTIDAALVGLLVTTTPTTASLATAAVLVYRAATYWLQTVLGGAFALGLGLRYRLV